MTDQVFDRAELAEAVGNDIADMAHFWMLRKFQFLEPAREQFEIIGGFGSLCDKGLA